ncbi:unnamed protein product [Brassica oleracea var. botrytis]
MRGLLASASSAVGVEFRRRQMLDMQERRSEYVNFGFSPKGDFGATLTVLHFSLSNRRRSVSSTSPGEYRVDSRLNQAQEEYYNRMGNVADSEYGIPKRCPCGGRIRDEVRVKEEYDTLPGKRFFTCINYEVRDTMQMDSLGFMNLLSSQTSQPIDVGSIDVGSSTVPKPLERKKWTTQEDIVLISAWLNTSKDPIVSNQQKLGSFWNRIAEYFNSSPQLSGFTPREWSQCKQRWGRVNEQVCKFVGSYEAALKEQASGQNENDAMKSAHDIFFNDYQLKFTLEHAWRELRFDQKWRSNSVSRDGPKEKRKEAAETEPELEEVRPPGIKASKAAKRKKHGNEAALDQIESILAMKTIISNRKILDRLLGKNADTLSDQERTLKNKLISEML